VAPASAPSSGAASPSASGTIPVSVGFAQATTADAVIFVASELGFFSRNGLAADLKQVNGPAEVPAILAGELQFAAVGGNEVMHADLGGASLVGLATLSDLPVFSLYADKKYKAVADLAGQTIGVTALGTTTHATAQLFLKHYDMLGKVDIAGTGGTSASIIAALTKGAVVAGILSPESASIAAEQGFVELVNGVKLGVPYNLDVIGVNRPYLRDHSEEVKRFLRGYQQAWTYMADAGHKTEVNKAIQKFTKSPDNLASVSYDAFLPVWNSKKVPVVNPEALGNILVFSPDPAAKNAKPEQFIDNSVIQSIQS